MTPGLRNQGAKPTLATDHGRDWREDAACLNAVADLFLPLGNSWPTDDDRTREMDAKAYCRVCPSQAPCLAWALAVNEPYAIAGGTTPNERRAMLRKGRAEDAPAKRSKASSVKCLKGHDTSWKGSRNRQGACKQCERERNAVRKDDPAQKVRRAELMREYRRRLKGGV
jgi:WhiB family redox-sensing transcriptional regulator